jgi:hypothetical protein
VYLTPEERIPHGHFHISVPKNREIFEIQMTNKIVNVSATVNGKDLDSLRLPPTALKRELSTTGMHICPRFNLSTFFCVARGLTVSRCPIQGVLSNCIKFMFSEVNSKFEHP